MDIDRLILRRGWALCLILCMALTGWSQGQISLGPEAPAPEVARFLTAPGDLMKDDQALVESVLDLVQVNTRDSIIEKEKQRLSGMYGVAGWMLARYWKKLDDRKRKYVGTTSRPFMIYDGFAKEVDMNIFLMPHLEPYIQMVVGGFETAFAKGRSEKGYRYDNPEYPSAEALRFKELGYLTVECEGTPAPEYREALAKKFIPTSKGTHSLGDFGTFGVEYPSMGLYGPWVMDCNHNCRPEIHPIEWMWWLDFSEDRPGSEVAKSWMVGLVWDASKRFKNWSPAPLTGEISIPVAFPKGSKSVLVEVEHLVCDTLLEDSLTAGWDIPAKAREGKPGVQVDILKGHSDGPVELVVRFKGHLPGNGYRWWWERLAYDPEKEMTFGELKIAVSTPKLYTGRITVDFQ